MITRAYVVDIKPGYAKVRIPVYDSLKTSTSGYTPDEELSWASIAATPGIEVNYKPGDVVLVGFQDSDTGRPLIIGHLKSALNYTSAEVVYPVINSSQLLVKDVAIFPKNITIGNIKYDQLQLLEDFNSISQNDIDSLFQ